MKVACLWFVGKNVVICKSRIHRTYLDDAQRWLG